YPPSVSRPSLHDALPIGQYPRHVAAALPKAGLGGPRRRSAAGRGSTRRPASVRANVSCSSRRAKGCAPCLGADVAVSPREGSRRSEEHTSELQSRENLVC